ncbi:Uncharacterised protein [Pantoea agglomerans]|uniref:Uncharacterized protein n=1 Tax=Enterobacter agglomerans TaxID=549 RepID=A0A379LQX2_ENTAG|nr:Uncharacterised protein [Pantoea agglomerans]
MLPVSRLNWPDMSKAGRSDTVLSLRFISTGPPYYFSAMINRIIIDSLNRSAKIIILSALIFQNARKINKGAPDVWMLKVN